MPLNHPGNSQKKGFHVEIPEKARCELVNCSNYPCVFVYTPGFYSVRRVLCLGILR